MDYLTMQKNFYGKVKEKYPEHFKTAHDVMALKVNLAKAAEQCQNFMEQAEQVKDLEYRLGYCSDTSHWQCHVWGTAGQSV